jgi:LPS O-antigen subunit length determinant protein (WzzB/FepE family)
MTEKEMPLTSTPHQTRNSEHELEDEINLLDMLEVLVRKKVLILSTASIFIVLSMFYAFSVTPIYRATVGFQTNGKSLTSLFPDFLLEALPNVSWSQIEGIKIKKNYILNKFIAELQSYSNQEEVFIAGNFHERFVASNPEIVMKEEIIREIYRSIHTSAGGKLSDKVVNYEMKGVNSELASDFLNTLADWVRSKVELDIQESIKEGAKARIALLSAQLKPRITKEQLEYEDKIRVFTDNIEIAKNLGILDNNFDNFIPEDSDYVQQTETINPMGRTRTNEERVKGKTNINWPIWYLYGQSALEHELNLLERRGVSSQYTKETAELIFHIEQLSSIDLSKIIIDPVIISEPSITPVSPINISTMKIIVIGIVLGLFIGILMAILSFMMTKIKESSKLSLPD